MAPVDKTGAASQGLGLEDRLAAMRAPGETGGLPGLPGLIAVQRYQIIEHLVLEHGLTEAAGAAWIEGRTLARWGVTAQAMLEMGRGLEVLTYVQSLPKGSFAPSPAVDAAVYTAGPDKDPGLRP